MTYDRSTYVSTENFHLVFVFDTNKGQPGLCVLAHNLNEYDSLRLAHRMNSQHHLPTYVIEHKIFHPERHTHDCIPCANLLDDIVEKCLIAAREAAKP